MMIFKATCPSNIALIKYWGKSDFLQQWPANDSLSMTLKQAQSACSVQIASGYEDVLTINHSNEDEKGIHRALHFVSYLRKELEKLGFARESMSINTSNNFPASCGLASSASSFAALTLAVAAYMTCSRSLRELADHGFDALSLANYARMGSGSACRSFLSGFVRWVRGKTPTTQSLMHIAPAEHWGLCDFVVMVSQHKKAISSSEGHKRAMTSPMFAPRLEIIPERISELSRAIIDRDIERLGTIMETEALDMSSVMMTSHPVCQYWQKETIAVICFVREQRRLGLPIWFTIDAGPNLHIICEKAVGPQVYDTLKKQFEFPIHCDETGFGPTLEVLSKAKEMNLGCEGAL